MRELPNCNNHECLEGAHPTLQHSNTMDQNVSIEKPGDRRDGDVRYERQSHMTKLRALSQDCYEMDLVKIVVLGAAGVGKTSVVQRFVFNEYDEKYSPTSRKETYFPSVIINDHLYEVKISDIPVISYFPLNTYCEWSDFRFYGLRNATAYVLVFDLSNVDTFQYVRTMREQMMESRDMKRVPLLIVGNKQDLVGGEIPGGPPALLPPGADAAQRKRRDIVNLVRKHWKCVYVECSARHNYGVVSVFKELMDVIDSMDLHPRSGEKEAFVPMMDNIQEAFDGNKCVIL